MVRWVADRNGPRVVKARTPAKGTSLGIPNVNVQGSRIQPSARKPEASTFPFVLPPVFPRRVCLTTNAPRPTAGDFSCCPSGMMNGCQPVRATDAPQSPNRHSPPAGEGGQVPDREPGQEARLLRLPRHQPGVRRAVHRVRQGVRRRRQLLHLPRLQGKHPRHLQAHRGRTRHAQGRPPAHLQKKKATVTRPEIALHYGEQLQLEIHLPPRHSDKLTKLAQTYFDEEGLALVRPREVPRGPGSRCGGRAGRSHGDVRRAGVRRSRDRAGRTARPRSRVGQAARSRHPRPEVAQRPTVRLPDPRRAVPRVPRAQHPRRRYGTREDRDDTRGHRELLARERVYIQKAASSSPRRRSKYQWESGDQEVHRARPVQVIDGNPEARLDQPVPRSRPSTDS